MATVEVTEEMVQEWKEKYGKIYRITHPDAIVYYRIMNRDDYMDIMQRQAVAAQTGDVNYDAEIETITKCVLNEIPFELLQHKSGIATVIHEEILKNSGFVVVESEEI